MALPLPLVCTNILNGKKTIEDSVCNRCSLRNCYCEFCQTYALHVLWTHYHDIDEGALCYSLFTTLVKSVFLLCGAFLSNSICFVVYN